MRTIALSALAVLAMATTATTHASDCFAPDRVRSFEVVSDREVLVDAGRNEYRVVFDSACPGIERADRVSFSSSPSSFAQSRLPTRLIQDAQSRGIAIVDPPHRVCGRGEWLVPSGFAFVGQSPSCRIAEVVRVPKDR